MINVNDTYEYRTHFTQSDLEAYAELTGDKNPVHLNKIVGKDNEFGYQVVYGMLIACAFSKVFGTMWPGEDSVYLQQDMIFLKPVPAEKDYWVKCKCTEIDRDKAIGTLVCYLKDEDGNDYVKVTARIRSRLQFGNPDFSKML